MNPILIFLIVLAGFLLWLLCAFLYKPIGKVAKRLLDDAKEEMAEEIKEEKEI